MTAIKPIENRRVVAVAAETYPVNTQCAWPDSDAEAVDPHHAFPRSSIGGDSYFVSITFDTWEEAVEVLGKNPPVSEVPFGDNTAWVSSPIPHVIGLSREIHDRIESRVSKIVLKDGKWVGYEIDGEGKWVEVGELSPQPGARGTKRRKRLKGDDRRKRKTISIRVPDDNEDGGAVWDETIERVKERLVKDELYSEGDVIPVYEAVIAGLMDWLDS